MKAKVCGLLLLLLFARVMAAPAPGIPYTRFHLDNGLTVVVHEDHKAPVVALSLWFHVGSADEPPAKSGFAHLFEHLMFSGSENYPGSFFLPMEQLGATGMNGTTWFDRTNYYETVPSTALDSALWLESDRMGHLLGAIGQKQLDAQRGVVQNEKREGENQAFGRVESHILRRLFPANHPYHHETVGSMADLDAASLADVQQWFRDYYGAANTTLVLAGDITPEEARAKVSRYFADIPSGPPVPRQQAWITPGATATRGVQHDHVAQTTIIRSWMVPQLGSEDSLALGLAARLLGAGNTSRLYRRLVYRDHLADDVSVRIEPYALASLFKVSVDVRQGVDPARVEAALADEWRQFLARGPGADELARAKMVNRANFIRSLEKVAAKAAILAEGQLYFDDPQAFIKMLARTQAQSRAAVRAAARRWLSHGAYTLSVVPAGAGFDAEREDRALVDLAALPGRPAARLPLAHAWRTQPSALDRGAGPPPVDHFPALRFPRLQRAQLRNGIPVILAERHTVPLTQVRLLFDAGFAADQRRKAGTAAFATALLTESTRAQDAAALARRRQRLGATLFSDCNLDSCNATLNAQNAQLRPSLAMLAAAVRQPGFTPADIQRLRGQTLSEIAQDKNEAEGIARQVLPRLLYGQRHAYGQPFSGSGTLASVAALNRQDLLGFQRDFLRPDNLHILVVGDTSLRQILPALNARFGDWKPPSGARPQKHITAVAAERQPRVFLVNRRDAPQSLILAAVLAPPGQAPDALDLGLANSVFGGMFTSRLNMNLREDKHWAYGASSRLFEARGPRPLVLSAPVQTDKTAAAIAEIFKEVTAIGHAQPLTPEEIAKVKLQRVRALPGYFETNAAVLTAMSDIVGYGWPDDHVETLEARIAAVNAQSAQTALLRVLHPEALTWLIIGDLARIEPAIRALKLGPLRVIDADGDAQTDGALP
jgi:predicted Zn-dependent peptidase